MKQINAIREQLGLTQQEIAMVLGVTRSQWSLYELGKRDLPLAATQLLAEMLPHMHKAETLSKKPNQLSPEKSQKELTRLILKNKHQIALISKTIRSVEKKQIKNYRASLLADFLKVREDKKEMAGFIKGKASKSLEKAGVDLFRNKLKLQLLQLQKQLLDIEIKKLS